MDDSNGRDRNVRNKRLLHGVFFWSAFCLVLGMCLALLLPFINALIFAGLIAGLSRHVHRRLTAALGGRDGIAAFLLTAAITLLLLIPLGAALTAVGVQAATSLEELNTWVEEEQWKDLADRPLVHSVLERASGLADTLGFSLKDVTNHIRASAKNMAAGLVQQGMGLVGGVTQSGFQLMVMLFALFFMIKDGPELFKKAGNLLPMDQQVQNLLTQRIRLMFRAVLAGNLLTAAVQGAAGAVGVAIIGLSPLFWGVMLALATFVPAVGTGLVFVPMTLWLAATGRTWEMLFLIIWALVVVSPIDNFLRPFLIPRESQLSPFTLFLAILGGLLLFGLPGLVYGPLLFGLARAMLDVYQENILEENREKAASSSGVTPSNSSPHRR